MNRRRFALTLAATPGLAGLASKTVAAQQASPAASPVPGQPGSPAASPVAGGPPPAPGTVVASGLLNPRYVALAADGTIYISEAGTGGDEVITAPSTPVPGQELEPGAPGGKRGTTGQVTAIAPDGTRSVVVTGLPSYATSDGTVGPAGITLAPDGTLLLAVGGAGPATAFVEPLPNEDSVLSIDPTTGNITVLADIGAYERANNPEPNNIDSNVYGIATTSDGTIYVNDAGGNTMYRIPAGGGTLEVVTVFEGLPAPEGMFPNGNPERGGANELDPVPTGVAINDAGDIFSGLLSGGPFPPGAAKVLGVNPDGTVTDVADGLSMVVGVAIGPDMQMYATQLSTNFTAQPPAPGNVVRLYADGTQEVVADNLMFPNGITFDQAGNMYVVVNTVSMGPPNGQVLRIEGVAAGA